MEKLTITKIYINDKDKNGNFFVGRDGNKYSKIAIKCKEYGDKYLSGFLSSWNKDWKEGMIVGAEVEKNGEFLNLKRPDPLKELEKRVEVLEAFMRNGHTNIKQAVSDDTPPF